MCSLGERLAPWLGSKVNDKVLTAQNSLPPPVCHGLGARRTLGHLRSRGPYTGDPASRRWENPAVGLMAATVQFLIFISPNV